MVATARIAAAQIEPSYSPGGTNVRSYLTQWRVCVQTTFRSV